MTYRLPNSRKSNFATEPIQLRCSLKFYIPRGNPIDPTARKICLREVCFDQISEHKVRPAEVRLREPRPAEVRLAEVRRDELRLDEVRRAEVRPAEVRLTEVRLMEGFCRKVRFLDKIQKFCVRNSMAYRLPNSRKSNFATEPLRYRAIALSTPVGPAAAHGLLHVPSLGIPMIAESYWQSARWRRTTAE
jgi:hypothetical protein